MALMTPEKAKATETVPDERTAVSDSEGLADAGSEASTETPPEVAIDADIMPDVPETPDSKVTGGKRLALEGEPSFLQEVVLTIRRGIWQNRLPTMMAIMVGSLFMGLYYGVPATEPVFRAVGDFEKDIPVLFSMFASMLCAGLAPMLVQFCLTRSWPKPFLSHLLFVVLFWSFLGVYVKGQYTFNAWLNGDTAELGTVIRKIVCDQFVFSPLVNYVWITACFRFRDCNFSCSEFRASLKDRRGLLLQFCAMNVANWSTWLPGVAVIYSMPSALQMPCWSVIIFFYSSLLTLISSSTSARETKETEAGPAAAEEV
eukprot:CAMPEP_0197657594 /NCGR_PEP_ID=MMETSP1338-20131121/44726_1 /TAXON_ID=43686 ORGANISM="Pelagodinium beii, Strain RCC1491" /NCGR_SAMPLE_ID=MMETSP1338 /ASSEMBLY_ACC=CAM_ASM_000754 /LENGTH=314 /DNA_ID=CAMNT_0043234003 /DNA_START=44 /DNA_END=988 /DNA_ORIENTATION=+